MKNKLLFVAGVATGYVVGARAGRSAYTALAEKMRTARSSDALRSAVGRVKAVAEERAPGLTSAISTIGTTTASVADAAATAPDPEQQDSADTAGSAAAETSGSEDAGSEDTGSEDTGSEDTGSEDTGSEDHAAAGSRPKPAPKRSRSKAGSSGGSGDSDGVISAEEAAQVFEEQLPESGGAIDQSASRIATEGGTADESENPTATS